MFLKKGAQYPIGIFDSGVGGLTVLAEVRKQLPQEPIVYFGDTARLPYGKRTQDEIIQYVREILVWMQSQQVKMVIMACNTSSALALDLLRQEFNVPMLGVILPGARAAVRKGRRIGVIATTATVNSEAYVQAIAESLAESNEQAKVWQVACPEFVPLIESNRINDPYTFKVAQAYLEPLCGANIDTLVFGCTHYPHLKPILQQILPAHVRFVDPATYVVRAAAQELEILGLRHVDSRGGGSSSSVEFYVSGDPEQFAQISHRWLGAMPQVEKVSLSPVELLS